MTHLRVSVQSTPLQGTSHAVDLGSSHAADQQQDVLVTASDIGFYEVELHDDNDQQVDDIHPTETQDRRESAEARDPFEEFFEDDSPFALHSPAVVPTTHAEAQPLPNPHQRGAYISQRVAPDQPPRMKPQGYAKTSTSKTQQQATQPWLSRAYLRQLGPYTRALGTRIYLLSVAASLSLLANLALVTVIWCQVDNRLQPWLFALLAAVIGVPSTMLTWHVVLRAAALRHKGPSALKWWQLQAGCMVAQALWSSYIAVGWYPGGAAGIITAVDHLELASSAPDPTNHRVYASFAVGNAALGLVVAVCALRTALAIAPILRDIRHQQFILTCLSTHGGGHAAPQVVWAVEGDKAVENDAVTELDSARLKPGSRQGHSEATGGSDTTLQMAVMSGTEALSTRAAAPSQDFSPIKTPISSASSNRVLLNDKVQRSSFSSSCAAHRPAHPYGRPSPLVANGLLSRFKSPFAEDDDVADSPSVSLPFPVSPFTVQSVTTCASPFDTENVIRPEFMLPISPALAAAAGNKPHVGPVRLNSDELAVGSIASDGLTDPFDSDSEAEEVGNAPSGAMVSIAGLV